MVLGESLLTRKRYNFVDLLKGIGIILAVLGHFIEPFREFSLINSFFIAIYFFHMPLFCFLSGFVAKFKIKTILRMGFYYLFSQIIFLLFSYAPYLTGIKGFLKAIVIPFWHLWYLYAMIFWLISLFLIDILTKKIPKCIVLSFFVLLALVSGYVGIIDKFALTRVISFYPYFLAAYLYKDIILKTVSSFSKQKYNWVKRISAMLFCAIIIAIMFFADNVNPTMLWNYQSYSSGNYTLINRLVFYIVSSIIVIAMVIVFYNSKSKIIEYIGKNTLFIFIFHAFIFWTLNYLAVFKILLEKQNLVFILCFCILCTIFCVAVFSFGPIYKFLNIFFDFPIKVLYRKNKNKER